MTLGTTSPQPSPSFTVLYRELDLLQSALEVVRFKGPSEAIAIGWSQHSRYIRGNLHELFIRLDATGSLTCLEPHEAQVLPNIFRNIVPGAAHIDLAIRPVTPLIAVRCRGSHFHIFHGNMSNDPIASLGYHIQGQRAREIWDLLRRWEVAHRVPVSLSPQ